MLSESAVIRYAQSVFLLLPGIPHFNTHPKHPMKPGGRPEGVSHVNTVTASRIFMGFKTAAF